MQTRQELIESLSNFIKNGVSDQLDLKEALLFGSYAKGTQNKYSDIDIALISEKYSSCDYLDEFVKAARIFLDFNVDIEPHLLCPEDVTSDTLFARELRDTGIVLFAR